MSTCLLREILFKTKSCIFLLVVNWIQCSKWNLKSKVGILFFKHEINVLEGLPVCVPVFKNSMYLQLFPSGKIYLQTVNVTIFVSFTFDLFDVMCRQPHETELNPFLNCTENGDIDGTYIRNCKFIGTFIFSFPAN